jgi:multicomponent Na+:H+ antiporter subunit C
MRLLFALIIGVLWATGLYMIVRRSIVKLIIGLALLSHAANLLIFVSGGLVRTQPPLILGGHAQPPQLFSDPLPQALILTAIVISFGVLAFALVLFHRAYQAVGADDIDQMKSTDT